MFHSCQTSFRVLHEICRYMQANSVSLPRANESWNTCFFFLVPIKDVTSIKEEVSIREEVSIKPPSWTLGS